MKPFTRDRRILVSPLAILRPAGLANLAGITFTVVALSAPGVATQIWRCRRSGRRIFVSVGFRPFCGSKRYMSKVNAAGPERPASA